jgi:hypothetical protein
MATLAQMPVANIITAVAANPELFAQLAQREARVLKESFPAAPESGAHRCLVLPPSGWA